MNHFLPTTTTSDEKERGAECAILPVGSFEQHGEYLPLITDTVIASVVSRELAGAYPLHHGFRPDLARRRELPRR
jgi:creatinine amidohydrolase